MRRFFQFFDESVNNHRRKLKYPWITYFSDSVSFTTLRDLRQEKAILIKHFSEIMPILTKQKRVNSSAW